MESKLFDDFRPDIVEFVKILLDEITEKDFFRDEQSLLLNKLFDLYTDGFWDTEANINIRNDIHLFIMGFECYKIYEKDAK